MSGIRALSSPNREAIKAAIRRGTADEVNGQPNGDIIQKGCEAAEYCDPDDAAEAFVDSIVDEVIAAVGPEAPVSIEALLAAYDAETEKVPLGHENVSIGASTYGWRKAVAKQMRDLHGTLRAAGTAPQGSLPNLADANSIPRDLSEAREEIERLQAAVDAAYPAMKKALRLCQIHASDAIEENRERRELRLTIFSALDIPLACLGGHVSAAVRAGNAPAIPALENGKARLADATSTPTTLQRDEAIEALRPFAAEADEWGDKVSDDYRPLMAEPGAEHANPGSEAVFTIGDLRRARSVLAQGDGA